MARVGVGAAGLSRGRLVGAGGALGLRGGPCGADVVARVGYDARGSSGR